MTLNFGGRLQSEDTHSSFSPNSSCAIRNESFFVQRRFLRFCLIIVHANAKELPVIQLRMALEFTMGSLITNFQ